MMTNEELNTALYQKMFAEQKTYTAWLKAQPSDQFLQHAYEYVMREDILLSLENENLTDQQAQALLKEERPLALVFHTLEHTETGHMTGVWDCVERSADALLERQAAEQMRARPVYKHSATYAHEHGELPQYRESYRANIACSKAIDAAIREHYRNNRLDPAAVTQVVEQYGMERTLFVLAATARYKERDGRIDSAHKSWAQTVPVPNDKEPWGTDHTWSYAVGYAHPGLVNLFMNQARKLAQEQQPSVHQQLQQKADTPAKKPPARKEPQR